MTLHLTTAQVDRAAGVLIGMACGDALGAGYEFGPPLGPDVPVTMTGGGSFGWAPGEWTDDTSMAIAIAEPADLVVLRARRQGVPGSGVGAELIAQRCPGQRAGEPADPATGSWLCGQHGRVERCGIEQSGQVPAQAGG